MLHIVYPRLKDASECMNGCNISDKHLVKARDGIKYNLLAVLMLMMQLKKPKNNVKKFVGSLVKTLIDLIHLTIKNMQIMDYDTFLECIKKECSGVKNINIAIGTSYAIMSLLSDKALNKLFHNLKDRIHSTEYLETLEQAIHNQNKLVKQEESLASNTYIHIIGCTNITDMFSAIEEGSDLKTIKKIVTGIKQKIKKVMKGIVKKNCIIDPDIFIEHVKNGCPDLIQKDIRLFLIMVYILFKTIVEFDKNDIKDITEHTSGWQRILSNI